MTDTITLPREVVERLVATWERDTKSLLIGHRMKAASDLMDILRTALAAEQPSEDAERYRKQKERSYRLQRLLKECVKVMQANAVFRDTKAHKDLKTRIRVELEDKT